MRRLLLLALLLLSSGCGRVTTNPQPVFEEVREDIFQRTGYSAQWQQRSNVALSICISQLLEQDLTAESAAYIALLNNPRLQAVYENLGIAKAQLVQAGLLKNPILALYKGKGNLPRD